MTPQNEGHRNSGVLLQIGCAGMGLRAQDLGKMGSEGLDDIDCAGRSLGTHESGVLCRDRLHWKGSRYPHLSPSRSQSSACHSAHVTLPLDRFACAAGGNLRNLRVLPLGVTFAHFADLSRAQSLGRDPGQAMAASLVLAWATATTQTAWYSYDKPSSYSPLQTVVMPYQY